MGRYAQAKRRGTSQSGTSGFTTPPPVFLTDWNAEDDESSHCLASNLTDGLGLWQFIHFEWRVTGSGPWLLLAIVGFGEATSVNVGVTGNIDVHACWSNGSHDKSDFSASQVVNIT